MAEPAENFRSGPGTLALWWGILSGPIALALDEGLSYAIVQHECSTGYYWLLHFYTGVTLALALSGLFCARWSYRQFPESESSEGITVASRARWMAIYGMASSLAFTLAIIAMSVPKWVMSPCDQ